MKRLILLLSVTLLVACQNRPATHRADLYHPISINYGVVQYIEAVKLDSNAPRNAVLGGMIGAMTSGRHNVGGHAIQGAFSGALLTAIFEGERSANAYQIKLNNGGQIKVMTEQSGIIVGDCVAIEQGRLTNIRRTSPVYCQSRSEQVRHEPQIRQNAQQDASACAAAKDMALQAQTQQQMDLALQKVQVFCDD